MRALTFALIAVVAGASAAACNDPDYQGGGRSMTFPSNTDSGGASSDSGEDAPGEPDTGGSPIEDAGNDADDTGVVVIRDAGSG